MYCLNVEFVCGITVGMDIVCGLVAYYNSVVCKYCSLVYEFCLIYCFCL